MVRVSPSRLYVASAPWVKSHSLRAATLALSASAGSEIACGGWAATQPAKASGSRGLGGGGSSTLTEEGLAGADWALRHAQGASNAARNATPARERCTIKTPFQGYYVWRSCEGLEMAA